MQLIDTIRKSPFFQSIDLQTLNAIAAASSQRHYSKSQEIFAMGDRADAFFIVLKGWVKLYRVSKEGEEVIIHVFGPGESFAEAAVFNDQKAYPVNAQAVENVSLMEIPRSFFVKKIEEDAQFSLRMLGAIASRQHYLVQQLEQVTARTAPQRIGAFLLRFCQRKEGEKSGTWIVDLPYDKSIISARLSIKPETFSRALSKLLPYGVVADKRKIIINDMPKLIDFCDVTPYKNNC